MVENPAPRLERRCRLNGVRQRRCEMILNEKNSKQLGNESLWVVVKVDEAGLEECRGECQADTTERDDTSHLPLPHKGRVLGMWIEACLPCLQQVSGLEIWRMRKAL